MFKELFTEESKKRYVTISVDGNCIFSIGVIIPKYVDWSDKNDPFTKKFYKEWNKAEKKAENRKRIKK